MKYLEWFLWSASVLILLGVLAYKYFSAAVCLLGFHGWSEYQYGDILYQRCGLCPVARWRRIE